MDNMRIEGGFVFAAGQTSSAEKTWAVNQQDKTIHLDNGYILSFEGQHQAWSITDPQGNKSRIWGDPHVQESDNGKWDFKEQTTFKLDDGTKITVKTKPWGNGSMTVSDELFITKGDQAITVKGIADNNVQISDVGMNGRELDRMVNDGYLVKEMGGVDDWSFEGKEVTQNLPFEPRQYEEPVNPLKGFGWVGFGAFGAGNLQGKFDALSQGCDERIARCDEMLKNQPLSFIAKQSLNNLKEILGSFKDFVESARPGATNTPMFNDVLDRTDFSAGMAGNFFVGMMGFAAEWSSDEAGALNYLLAR